MMRLLRYLSNPTGLPRRRSMATTKDDPKSVDEATHGSGNRNADHGTGSDQQELRRGIKEVPRKPKAPARPLPPK
jgi:hypothetical protein